MTFTTSAEQRALLLLLRAVGEDDLDDRLNGVLACPAALQLDREREPADRLRAGWPHAVKAGQVPPIAARS